MNRRSFVIHPQLEDLQRPPPNLMNHVISPRPFVSICSLLVMTSACSQGDSSAAKTAGGRGQNSGGALIGEGSTPVGGDSGANGGKSQVGGGSSGGSTGGASTEGGSTGTASAGGANPGNGGASSGSACDNDGLVWKSARKTNYTSYPDPNSVECIEYNGCMWAGWFAGCNEQQTETWVENHNIAALFPAFESLNGHEICIRSGEKNMIVHIVDTCADSDCDGCCTKNQANNDALVDLESYTNARWGLADGIIEWADLGPAAADICE